MLDMSAASPRPNPPRHEPRYQPLVVVLAAAAAGILADRYWSVPLWAWSTAATAGLLLWIMALLLSRFHPLTHFTSSTAAIIGNVALLAAVAAMAAGWHHCRWCLFGRDDLGRYAQATSQPVAVEVTALSAPRRAPPSPPDPMQPIPSEDRSQLDVEVTAMRDGPQWQPASGRARLVVQGAPPAIEAGDRLRCFVHLSAPPRPQNPGASDRSAYLRAERIRSRLTAETPECLTVIEPGSPWTVTRLLSSLRLRGDRMLKQSLDPRQAELASAVLLGYREELDTDRTQAFMTTGTVHILSISGLHVGILAGAMFWIMRRTPIPRGWALVLIASVTVLYALMVDAEPPVVRSTVLVLVACSALLLGQRTLGMNSLAAAALVVLAINPAHLFHVGAQLSFLCVAVLIWIAHWRAQRETETERTLERLIAQNLGWFARLRQFIVRGTIDATAIGLAIGLVTLPLVMARFHIFSLAAIVLNALLWTVMSLSVLSGFAVLLVGAVYQPAACLCGWLCDGSFSILEWSIGAAHCCPGSHFWVPGPADWWLWGFYGGLGAWLALPRLCPSRRWCAGLLIGWMVIGFAAFVWPHRRDRLDCTFLSMGHGCAVFLELPSAETMLYDAGQMGPSFIGARSISEFLWDRGLTHIDAVVLSHPDADHYNALPGLLEKFSVGAVYVTPRMFAKDNEAIAALRSAVEKHAVPVRIVKAGDRLTTEDGCTAEVLHPLRHGASGSDNANSLVLSVYYRGHTILLTGDIEASGLNNLLADDPRHATILLAPHHGSRQSNSPELAKWCTPEYVVLSGDGRWSTAGSEATYRAVGGTVLHTCSGGAIAVRVDEEGVHVSQFSGKGCSR